jgi:hypothetical protein
VPLLDAPLSLLLLLATIETARRKSGEILKRVHECNLISRRPPGRLVKAA